jgi:transcriptional regulator GlxA family with amidase domain
MALLDMIDAPQAYASAGEQATINQLVKVLLLETLRTYARDQYGTTERAVDWLRAALDPEIGGALSLIHSQPEQPWTVQSLAGQIHMSRSAFAERFRQLVGDSPLQYLTKCRMQKAGRMLRETELGVKEIASLAGYESVTSFSSAFKRQTGASPAAFRKGEHAVA